MNNVIYWDGFKLVGLALIPIVILGGWFVLWVSDKYYNWKHKRKNRK